MTPPSSAQIWLVEDSTRFCDAFAAVLTTDGFAPPLCFTRCEDALAALESGGLPDLVLMDIGLPGLDGIEGVRRVKALAPTLPVVMLTVHQDNDRIFAAVCAGASGYLLKSSPRETVVDGIRQVLAGGGAMDAQIARRVLEMFARLAAPQADYGLSEREREILQLLVDGHTKAAIAERLFLSPHTVDGHVRNVYAKLHVHNRSGAVAKALRERLV